MSLSNPLNAFITRLPDTPARGVRFAVKDLIATAGVRTTAGSRILADWIPGRSAPVVRALESAGYVMIGKTNTHEFAFGTTNDNPHFGAAQNPWHPGLTTGGSSGGSAAAVAAGVVPVALGTDTAGSVRIPAALCGCVGFKPGWGVVSARGVIPLAPSLDTVGFLTATVADSARAFAAVVHSGPPSPVPRPRLSGVTIGLIESHAFDRVEDDIVASIEAALRLLESRGARIRRIATQAFADVMEVGVPLVRSEAWKYHRQWFPARRDEYGPDVARSLDAASRLSPADYRGARRGQSAMEKAARKLTRDVDLLAGPTVPVTAFPNRVAYEPVAPGGDLPRFALTRLTYPFSLSRLPAISVPSGLSSRRLPIGLQLAAGPGREQFLLGVAAAYESARGPLPRPPEYFGTS